jgi:hypothetical protein
LRCVKALKLSDEAGVDDVGEHLVGDLLSGQNRSCSFALNQSSFTKIEFSC